MKKRPFASFFRRLVAFILVLTVTINSVKPTQAMDPVSLAFLGFAGSLVIAAGGWYLDHLYRDDDSVNNYGTFVIKDDAGNWYDGSIGGYVMSLMETDPDLVLAFLDESCPGWQGMTDEELVKSGYFAKIVNAFSYNEGYYQDEAQYIKDGFTPSEPTNDFFTFWQPIPRGIQDRFHNSTNSISEQMYVANEENNLTWVVPQLITSETLDLVYDIRGTSYSGIGIWEFNYFASAIFNFSEETNLSLYINKNNYPILYDGSSTSIEFYYAIFQYNSDSLSDPNYLNVLNNYNWSIYSDWEYDFTEFTFSENKDYILVVKSMFYNLFSLSNRPESFAYIKSPTITVNINSGAFLTEPSQPQDPIYNTYITNNYVGDYYDNSGNWWSGDNNGDGDVDVGGGSGDSSGTGGNITGDLDVNVDGELDHNHSGKVDVDININTDEIQSTSKNIVILLVDALLDFLLDLFLAVTSPIIDIFTAFADGIIGRFTGLLDTTFANSLRQMFALLPEEVADLYILMFFVIGFLGMYRFIKS